MSRRQLRAHLRRVGVSTAMLVVAAAAVIPAVAQETTATSPGCEASDNANPFPNGVARDNCEEPAPDDPGPVAPDPVVPDPDEPAATSTDVAVLSEQSIQRNGQIVTVSGPDDSDGTIELAFGDDVNGDLDGALSAACEALAGSADPTSVRLGPNVFVVVPSSFDAGDEVMVTSTVPAAAVRQALPTYDGAPTGDLQVGPAPGDAGLDTTELLSERLTAIRANRGLPADPGSDEIWVGRVLAGTHVIGDARTAISAKATYWNPASFGVCFAGEKADPGALSGLEPFATDTGLFGPVLLPICSSDTGAPCIDQRTATEDGAVELVTRIPAEDPWMR